MAITVGASVVGIRFKLHSFSALVVLLVVGFSGVSPASAQGFFCPGSISTNLGTQPGIALSGGNCTNGTTGAFSNAALAAQALSDVSQAATIQSTQVALDAISARRRVETEACPAGYVRRNDTCERVAEAEPAPATSAPSRPAAPRRRATETAAPVYKAPIYKAPIAPQPTVTFASWVKAYGDFEKRTGSAQTSIDCCSGIGGIANPLTINSTSKATTGGVLGGFDATWRGISAPGDGLIAGVLVGYMSTDTKLVTTSSTTTGNVASGSATLNAHMTGPSVGAYLTYFRGQFSSDLTFKADFLDLDINFTDMLGFSANVVGGNLLMPTNSVYSGAGSTSLTNYTTAGNLNYRFPTGNAWWVQPTVGFQYTSTQYSSGAAAFGLANGSLFRLQGGAVFGTDFYSGGYRVTPSVTALLYDDVSVSGGFISNGLFSTVPLGLADEGKIRGQGLFTVNIDNGRGVSGFIQGEVRGGSDLIGYAGRAGVRWQWGMS